MAGDYDIAKAFQAIENELIASMIRNLDRHRAEETLEGFEWSMWQVEQLKALEAYKKNNRRKYGRQFENLNGKIKGLLQLAKEQGGMEQEIKIMQAMYRGYSPKFIPPYIRDFIVKTKGKSFNEISDMLLKRNIQTGTTGEFFLLNERKLNTLIKATTDDMKKAETAVLRMANDQYRKTIFNAQVYANSGAGTYEKAVDMATRDMLAAGLNCVQYKNGARHTLSDYADMAIRTANKRAYLQGEGEKRQEWRIATVTINKRGNPCPKCLPFAGKVLIDDIWSGGKPEDGPYPLISHAVSKGLYHPRCRDSHTTYFPGLSTADNTWTQEELTTIKYNTNQEAEQQYAKRQFEKFKRLEKYSLSPDNKKQYRQKAEEWKEQTEKEKLTIDEMGAVVRYISPSSIALNDRLRTGKELTSFEKEWIINLNKALDKLPNYKGNLNRSLTFMDDDLAQKFFDNLKTEVAFPQYISATKAGIYNPEGQVQIYIQNSKKSKDLKGMNDMENEVLYPINSKFRVINKVKQGDKFYILLEEVEK